MSDDTLTPDHPVLSYAQPYTTLLLREVRGPEGQLAPNPYGTAVLLTVANEHFMVTAAHNISGKNLLMWTRRSGGDAYVVLHDLESYATSLANDDAPIDLSASPNQSDALDVAVTHFPRYMVEELGESLAWLRLEHVRWSTDPAPMPGSRYIVGYPSCHGTLSWEEHQITSTLFAWRTEEHHDVRVRRHEWEMPLLMQPESALPDAQGMSGCGVWEEVGNTFRLVAIEHGQTAARDIIRSTRIEVVLQMIHLNFPNLRRSIELHLPLSQDELTRFSSCLVCL